MYKNRMFTRAWLPLHYHPSSSTSSSTSSTSSTTTTTCSLSSASSSSSFSSSSSSSSYLPHPPSLLSPLSGYFLSTGLVNDFLPPSLRPDALFNLVDLSASKYKANGGDAKVDELIEAGVNLRYQVRE